jgi:hypothetical protein
MPRDLTGKRTEAVALVVGMNRRLREDLGGMLEEAGLEVLACQGPQDSACIGLSAGRCALADAADVVFLDGVLDGDVLTEGPSSQDLAAFYLAQDLPVVQVDGDSDPLSPGAGPDLQVVRTPIRRAEIVGALRRALRTEGVG